MVERRRSLRDGALTAGDKSGVLADTPAYVDLEATDKEYKRNKSGLWLILKIARYMIFSRRSKLGPLLEP